MFSRENCQITVKYNICVSDPHLLHQSSTVNYSITVLIDHVKSIKLTIGGTKCGRIICVF